MEGYISGRFFSASENESQKAFEGRNGKIRSENNSNHLPKPAEASWARDSNGRSSVINVDDLGFSESGPLIQPITGPRDREFMSVEMLRENLNLAPKNDTSVKESIREKIKLSLVRSHSDYYGAKDRRFLPIDKLNTILSDESIKALLLEEYSQIAEQDLNCKLGDYTSRRRILGILLFMYPAHLRLFECFINEKIADKDLPLTPNGGTDEIGFQTRLGIKNTTMLMKWEDNDITLFYNYQPIFLAPFFYIQEDRLCNYSLDETIRLPWLKYTFINRGGNGKVHKVEIHPSHHNFINHQSSSSPVCFALKEIPTLDVDTYQQELLALEKTCVQMRKERHLIKLLLTFQHGQKYYLLFECADSNLWDYWSKYSNGPKDAGVSSLWMAEQCLGLATAVKRIHGLATWQKKRRDESGAVNEDEREWGRHGDIKPQNILCFSSSMKDDGLLVLSDLGLTRYHSSVTRSQVSPTSIDGCTKLYRPPEMDMPGQHICSKYDIWSLGCVFLELCTWWLRGLRSVQEFESRRDNSDRIFANLEYFFISETDGVAEPRVKDTVLEV
ncbi:kinase-like domain-containing protein [Xylaria scruposa]|nr:kinase-like domain-containing protein [Xylaria scruposa]